MFLKKNKKKFTKANDLLLSEIVSLFWIITTLLTEGSGKIIIIIILKVYTGLKFSWYCGLTWGML